MKKVIASLVGFILVSVTSAALADDPASLFVVREQGSGTAGLALSAQQQTQTDTISGGNFFQTTDDYRFKSATATLSGSLGVGYGFELFLDLPNALLHQTIRDGATDHLSTGFGDAEFGFKYRLFGSEQTADRMLLRATFSHHSSSLGTDQLALYYAHTFSPEISVGLETFYEYEAYGNAVGKHYRSNQYGGAGLLFWNVAPNVSLIPLLRIYGTDSYLSVPSEVTSEAALELSYYWSRHWSVTPSLGYLHTSGGHDSVNPFVSINYGVRDGGLASVLLQYQF